MARKARLVIPNLRDDSWLWGGTLEDIHQPFSTAFAPTTRRRATGARCPHSATTGMLRKRRSATSRNMCCRSRAAPTTQEAAGRGGKIFADNCAPCHGAEGKGNQALGAPDLTDELWLYGGDKATIAETIMRGRGGVMPAWATRLDPETIKELAVYVHSLGGGQ